jgi:glucokinase-like ROK family protein
LVFEKSAGDSSGGRPPILLGLNPQGGFVIGVKLTEKVATAALTDLEANIIYRENATLTGSTPDTVVDDLAELIKNILFRNSIEREKTVGIGVGLAGIVDSANGVVKKSPFFGWRNVAIRDMLQDKLDIPVYIENDVNTLTLTERLYGSGHDIDDFVVITVGRGVGLGIVVNGQFYRGASGGAGELGHTIIQDDGPLCDCGKRGCLETFVGDQGLVREAQLAFGRGEIKEKVEYIEQLLALANKNDQNAIRIYARAGEILGKSVVNLIQVLNPSRILISGEGTRAGNHLFVPMKETVNKYTMPELLSHTEILVDSWGDDDWARGAASLVLQELFKSPV